MHERYHWSEAEMEAYIQRSLGGPCFVCEILAGNPQFPHHIVFEDEICIAFLNRYPTLYGYTLLAPRQHLEHVTGDFTLEAYLELQKRLYIVAEAVRQEVSAERVYMLSLGSQQGNSHVHWHIAPLPKGVPYREQQFDALGPKAGFLKLPEEEQAALAARIRQRCVF